MPNADLSFWPLQTHHIRTPYGRCKTDENGWFRFEHDSMAYCTVFVSPRDRALVFTEASFSSSSPPTLPLLIVTQHGGEIAGRVLYPDGDGAGDIYVDAYVPGGPRPKQRATSRADGSFTIKRLPPGQYELRAEVYLPPVRRQIPDVEYVMGKSQIVETGADGVEIRMR